MFDTQLLYENSNKLFRVEPSLSTSIGTLTLERPSILASGILGISLDIFDVYTVPGQVLLSQNH